MSITRYIVIGILGIIAAMFGIVAVKNMQSPTPLLVPEVQDVAEEESGLPARATEERTVPNSPQPIQEKEIERAVSLPNPLVRSGGENGALTPTGILSWTNTSRVREGVTLLLAKNTVLNEVARLRLKDMFDKQYFEHISPTGIGASDIAEEIGYGYLSIGENIALGNFSDDEDIVTAWMNSPGHRANILNTRFTELGVAVGKGVYQGKTVWIGVQIFGRPLSLCLGPSTDLRAWIDRNRALIEDLDSRLRILSAELERMRDEKPLQEKKYNAVVEEYNILVNEINPLSQATEKMVEEYNSQVRVFNACAQG